MVAQTRAYLGWTLISPVGPTVRRGDPVRWLRASGDARLQDPQVLDEIELYGELVIAASASEQPLSRDEIDRVLGLRARRRATSAPPG